MYCKIVCVCVFVCVCQSLSSISLFTIPWTLACQAPLSMEFSRHEYWSGQSLPSPGILPMHVLNPGLLYCRWILHCLSHQGSPHIKFYNHKLLETILAIGFSMSKIKNNQFSCSVMSDLCDPMNCSTPGLPVHHQLPELTQTHVHRVGDAIQPSHPLSSPSPPDPNPSLNQGLFQ